LFPSTGRRARDSLVASRRANIRVDANQLEQLNAYANRQRGECRVTVRCGGSELTVDIIRRTGKGRVYRAKDTPLGDVADIASAQQVIDKFVDETRNSR
jgi:Holliday junction resolvase